MEIIAFLLPHLILFNPFSLLFFIFFWPSGDGFCLLIVQGWHPMGSIMLWCSQSHIHFQQLLGKETSITERNFLFSFCAAARPGALARFILGEDLLSFNCFVEFWDGEVLTPNPHKITLSGNLEFWPHREHSAPRNHKHSGMKWWNKYFHLSPRVILTQADCELQKRNIHYRHEENREAHLENIWIILIWKSQQDMKQQTPRQSLSVR